VKASLGTETKKEEDREKILVAVHNREAKTIVCINKGWILYLSFRASQVYNI